MDNENKTATIGKEFTIGELIKFVSAPVMTRLLMSLLRTLDDSLFLSRYCGQNALAAFSIAMPWFMIVDAVGMMLGAVGTLCSMKLGERKREEAESIFTTIVIVSAVAGLGFTLILTLFRTNILKFLGATEILLPYGLSYMNVSRFYTPMVMLSYIFSRFYVIAGKPKHSMITMGLSTICNFFFDWLFIVKLQTGIVGAAYANLIGNSVTTIYAIIFFSNKKHEIAFGKPLRHFWKELVEVAKMGRSQTITSLALSFNSYLNNHVLLGFGGENMVAANTIVSNIQFMFMESFFGLVSTTSPIASYAYGEKNAKKLSKIMKQTVILVAGLSIIIVGLFIGAKDFLLSLYMQEGEATDVREMVLYGMKVVPLGFFIFGFNVMVQDLATSVGNNKACVFLSTIENILFSNAAVLILPRLFGANGIWYCFLTAELATFFFTVLVVWKNRNVYGYGKSGAAAFTADFY